MSDPLSVDLAVRIERTRVAYRQLRLALLAESGLPLEEGPFRVAEIGGAVMTDWAPMPRVFLFGSEGLDRLDEILSWYADAGRSPHFEMLPLVENDAVLAALGERGFSVRYVMSVLVRAPETSEPPVEARVRRSPDAEILAWAGAYIDGHGWTATPDERPAWLAELAAQYAAPEIARYAVDQGDGLAAIAASYVGADGGAYLTNCAVLPGSRGAGLHAAFIRRRVADVSAAGARVIGADARPYSTSQRNLERCGFRLAYQKLHLERA